LLVSGGLVAGLAARFVFESPQVAQGTFLTTLHADAEPLVT